MYGLLRELTKEICKLDITIGDVKRMLAEAKDADAEGALRGYRDGFVDAGVAGFAAWGMAYAEVFGREYVRPEKKAGRKKGERKVKRSEVVGEAHDDVVEGLGDADRVMTGNERDMVQWVFDNMAKDDVGPGDAPSMGAWGYLMQCRSDDTIKRSFYSTVWPKLLPSRSELERDVQMRDDDRELESHLEELKRWRKRQ